MPSLPRRRGPVAATVLLTALVVGLLAGCSGGKAESAASPTDRLAAAKSTLDKTDGVHITLKADKLPQGVSGILAAEGVGTHAPAFEGTLKVSASGITADAEVVAVGGEVFAKLPFTTNFAKVDPADYGAPDPAALMAADGGLSSLLTAAQDVQQGDKVRDGEVVLSTLTGTVPGTAVASVIPSADRSADFDATFTLDDSDRLTAVQLRGPFYATGGAVTYTVDFDQYGVQKSITAP